MHNHDPVQLVQLRVEDDGSIAPLLLIIAGTVPGAGHGVRVAVGAGSIGHGHAFIPPVQVGLVMVPGPVATWSSLLAQLGTVLPGFYIFCGLPTNPSPYIDQVSWTSNLQFQLFSTISVS